MRGQHVVTALLRQGKGNVVNAQRAHQAGGVLLHVPLQHRPCATAAHLLQSLHHLLSQPLIESDMNLQIC